MPTAVMNESYERYYDSAVYDSRYPRPNPRTLRYLERVLSKVKGDLVDIGAGNGRYAVPLAQHLDTHVWAVERSSVARRQLEARVAATRARVSVVETLEEVPTDLPRVRGVLLLFGVLAHLDESERREMLEQVRGLAAPSTPLIGSVPNALRRFRSEQASGRLESAGSSRVEYTRDLDGHQGSFHYSVYTPRTLTADLAGLGWNISSVVAESLLPESVVTRHRVVGAVDAAVSALAPSPFGYGLLYTATHRSAGHR